MSIDKRWDHLVAISRNSPKYEPIRLWAGLVVELADELGRLEKQLGAALEVNKAIASETSTVSVPSPVDHGVLDIIADVLNGDMGTDDVARNVTRESECVEFIDPTTDQRYEIIVREIG